MQTNRQVGRQSDVRAMGKFAAGGRTGRQADRRADLPCGLVANRLISGQAGWHVGGPADMQADGRAGWRLANGFAGRRAVGRPARGREDRHGSR